MLEDINECPGAGELIGWHEQLLSEQSASIVARHLESCVTCRAELDELALNSGMAQELHKLPPGLEADASSSHPSGSEIGALQAILRESAEGDRYDVRGELGRCFLHRLLQVSANPFRIPSLRTN